MNAFKELLDENGIVLCYSGERNILQQPQSRVISKLENTFKNAENLEEIKTKFMDGLKTLFECDDLYENAFLPCNYKKIIEESGNMTLIDIKQDSLIKLLLNTALQPELITVILESIADTVINDEENVKKLNTLLNTLRYLPFLFEADYLSSKLLEIVELAPLVMQYEILYAIPEILPDNVYEGAAREISKLLSSNVNITGAIVDCLNAINMSKSVRGEIQEYIVNEVLTSRNIDIFPILYDFLISDCNFEGIHNILSKIRTVLNNIFINIAQTNNNNESMKVIIIGKIKNSSALLKEIYNGWLTLISDVKVDHDHKPIDLLILFILHSISSNRKQLIYNIFKRHIKSKLFKLSLIKICLKDYVNAEILQECLTSIVEIGHNLLKTKKERLLMDFATEMYKSTFLNSVTTFVQRQIILQNLILQVGFYDQENVSPVLNVFRQFLDDKNILKQHHLKLLELLEKLDACNLRDVRTVFDILCSIIYYERDDERMSSVQNELHILIRKHVTCSKTFLKHRGIVCSVVMAKHIATTDEDQSEIEVDSESILDITRIPSEAAREATKLLQLTYTASSNLPILKALYYDELSSMLISANKLDRYFVGWLFETITQHFQDVFITETLTNNTIDGITLTSQYCINATEEMEADININIASLTMSTTSTEGSPILILAPIFRLLRLLHYLQHDGDLNSIDALLGCGIIMPQIEVLENFSNSQMRKIIDCLFHCINWFREVISAFTSQKLRLIRQKILKRLNHLIELENLLRKCIEQSPGHKLPDSYFNDVTDQSNKLGSPKKTEPRPRPRKRPRLNETDANTTTTSTVAAPAHGPSSSSSKKNKAETKYIRFRDIDIETIKLLRYPLGGNTIEETPSTQQTNLNLKQFNFLINDFASKLHSCLKGKSGDFPNLYVIEPKKVIIDCSNLLPMIGKHLKVIINSLNMILDECEDALDSDELFTEEAKELKISFKTITEMLSLIYSWSGFHQSDNYDLLISCLKSSVDNNFESPDDLISSTALIRILLRRLSEYQRNCLQLESAVHLIETMKELYSIDMNPEYQKMIVNVTDKMLTRRWYNLNGDIDTGRNAFVNLDIIIGAYFQNRKIKFIAEFVSDVEEEIDKLKTKKDYLNRLPCIDKANFHVLFKGVCQALLERLKVEIQSLANNEHLTLWKTVTKSLEQLISIVKCKESRGNFLSFFKKTHGILKIFLNKGIPMLQIMLKSNPNEVIGILKSIQITTRFLQNLCCHSKLTKDAALIKFVPHCKCTLETIIYRVKSVLYANGCKSSFWMGNLKNKDLNGEIISSQSTSNSEYNEDTEEMLPEDEDDEDLFSNEDDTANQEI